MSGMKEYERMPGGRFISLAGRRSLWKGTDHLLYLTYRGFTEEYRRFYFSDIQAVLFRKTSSGKLINAFIGGIAFLFALWAFLGWQVQRWEDWAVVTVSAFAILFLISLVVNLVLGPTCKFYLRTAVQIQQLHSVRRVRQARRAIDIIQSLVEGVQGSLSPDQIPAAPAPTGSFSLSSFPTAAGGDNQ